MYIEVDENNYVLGYSDKPSGTSIETQQNIPRFTNIQKLKLLVLTLLTYFIIYRLID